MSFFWQRSSDYNAYDAWQNLSDILLVTGLLSEAVRKKYESRILSLLWWSREWSLELRQKCQALVLESIDQKEKKWMQGLDRINGGHQALLSLYEIIAKNPELIRAFRKRLEKAIDVWLWQENTSQVNISRIMEQLTPDEFNESISHIQKKAWHIGVVYFLGECIESGKCLDEVGSYIHDNVPTTLAGASVESIDFFNLQSRLAFRKKLDQRGRPTEESRAFSLSGGISNAIAELWYIREHYRNGGRVTALAGSSMWAIIAVLIAQAVGDRTWEEAVKAIDSVANTLKAKLGDKIVALWKIGKLPFLNVNKIPQFLQKERSSISKDDAEAMRDIFTSLAKDIGIKAETKFSDLKIPVIINASYQSSSGSGEKEVIISGENLVIDALIAWTNMPWFGTNNTGIFWETKLQGQALVDFAANEQWNPAPLLWRSGIEPKNIVNLDVGYSSTWYHTWAAAFSRRFFLRADMRDNGGIKPSVRMAGWMSVDFDVEPTLNSSWSAFSPDIVDRLMKNGGATYQNNPIPVSTSLA